jgi:Fe-S cluster assembly protein SufD
LNTAFFSDGALVVIPAGMTVARPVHLVFASTGAGEASATYPRNLIVAGEGSKVTIVETFLSDRSGVYLTDAVTEIAAGPGAAVDYCKVERESSRSFHVATIAANVGRDASLISHSISTGAAIARNDLRVALTADGGQCALYGLFIAGGDRLADNHTEIDHRKPHTTSRELYKCILAGHGHGVFNGAVIVRKDAQKSNAVQHSKNLLLSEHSQIDTKPQLEIRADDVRCAHGATIGQVNRQAMFYLRSRGLDERTAKRILIRGFAAEILQKIPLSDLRRQLNALLDGWFGRELEEA